MRFHARLNSPGDEAPLAYIEEVCNDRHASAAPSTKLRDADSDKIDRISTGTPMRISVSHDLPKEEIKQAIDRSFGELFKGIAILPIQLVQQRRTWEGNRLTFSLLAQMGLVSTPIKGTVEVTDQEVIIDVDLGLLERFLPSAKVREVVGQRIKALLK